MSKQKNKLFIGVAILLFIILVYVSLNKCVAHFLNEELQLKKIDFEDYNCDTHVFLYMNPFEYFEDDNLFETMRCTGWAFIPSSEDNADTHTFLILKGKKGSYITADCGGFYDEIHNTLKEWKDIPGSFNQFWADFSTINLPDDIYDIYIYIEDGKKTKGISQTNYAFKKKGIHLYNYTPHCNIIPNFSIPETEDNAVNGWVNVACEPEYVQVSGWATLDSIPPEDTKYFVLFKGNNGSSVTVEAIKTCRTDVVRTLNDPLYTESGYCCGIETEQLPDSAGTVSLIIQYQDKYYQSGSQEFSLSQQ